MQETALENAAEMSGAVALIFRGGCSFAEKARRAQAAGALAVVFVNSDDEETHPAPDAEDDGLDITIPVACAGVSSAKAAGFFAGLALDEDGGAEAGASGVWEGVRLRLINEWVAVPVRPSPTAGRIVSVEVQLGARAEGDGSNWSLQVYQREAPEEQAEDGGAVLKLVGSVAIAVEVEAAERQSVPLFKGLGQEISVEEGQYIGLASADGPMNLKRLATTGAPVSHLKAEILLRVV